MRIKVTSKEGRIFACDTCGRDWFVDSNKTVYLWIMGKSAMGGWWKKMAFTLSTEFVFR